jgi:hypothetical protein
MYGKISLRCLNIVSRYATEIPGLRGYVSGYGQASKFFNRNFAWTGLVFVYLVANTLFTGMQVGLSADQLKDNGRFNWASYVFAVFCILLPVTIVTVLLLRHVVIFLQFSAGLMRKTNLDAAERAQTR